MTTSLPQWIGRAVLTATLFATAAHADTTADQARTLDGQIRSWIGTQLGALVDVAALPLRIVAQGDLLLLDVPFGGDIGQGAAAVSPGAVSVKLKPLEGGRYSVEDARITSPLSLRATDGPKGAPTAMSMAIAEQTTRGIIDPNFATTSSLTTKFGGYVVTVDTPNGRQSSTINTATSHQVWQPAGDGRVNATGESVLEGYSTSDTMPDGTPTRLTVERVRVSAGADKFDFARLGFVLRSGLELTGVSSGGATKLPADGALTPQQKVNLRQLIGELGALFESVRSEQVWENARLQMGPNGGSLRKLAMGFSMGAPKGMIEARFPIAVEGFDSPQIPPGPLRDVLPRSVSLTPRVSGVSKAALMTLLTDAVDAAPDTSGLEQAADTLLAAGSAAFGIDDLAFDIGPMKVTGSGELLVGPAREVTGEAEIRATGLDALIRRANATPDLKAAAPVLIFLKGIGRQDGQAMVWAITYADKELMVNDTNISDMMPQGR